jgi:hypothetical protein
MRSKSSGCVDSATCAPLLPVNRFGLLQFPQKVSRAVDGDRLVIVELVALGDRDFAREDDHEARSDLADGKAASIVG